MTTHQEQFGELRSLLMGKQTTHTWNKICRLLETWDDEDEFFLDVVLPYAMDYLKQWPSALRKSPQRWVKELIDGHAVNRLKAACILNYPSKGRSDEVLHNLLISPSLESIEHIVLSGNYGNARCVDAIVNSPFLSNVTALTLAENRLNRSVLARLIHSTFFKQIKYLDVAGESYYYINEPLSGLELFDHEHCASLEHLNFAQNHISTDDFTTLICSNHLPLLTSLTLHRFQSSETTQEWEQCFEQFSDEPTFTRFDHFQIIHYNMPESFFDALKSISTFKDTVQTQIQDDKEESCAHNYYDDYYDDYDEIYE